METSPLTFRFFQAYINCLRLILIFLPPFGMLLKIDPFFYSIPYFLPNRLMIFLGPYGFIVLRWFLITIALLEICRNLIFLFILLFTLLQNIIGSLKFILELGNSVGRQIPRRVELNTTEQERSLAWILSYRSMKSIRCFRTLQIVFVPRLQVILSNVFCSLLAIGLAASVVSNFVTFRMSYLIPMPLFLYFPCMSFYTAVLIYASMFQGIRIHGTFESILRGWRTQAITFPRKNKLFSREVRSISPFTVKVMLGNNSFFQLKRSVKTTFYWALIERSINAMLSIKI
jgi:hypothetical protein